MLPVQNEQRPERGSISDAVRDTQVGFRQWLKSTVKYEPE
jgi:hypothetical protein